MRDFILAQQPKVIVHAAAERRPDVSAEQPEQVLALNVESTRHLAQCAKEVGAYLIYISTDYVFDGTQPPYEVDDQPSPLNFYGETKLAGERALAEVMDDYAVLRVPVLYGQVEYWG